MSTVLSRFALAPNPWSTTLGRIRYGFTLDTERLGRPPEGGVTGKLLGPVSLFGGVIGLP